MYPLHDNSHNFDYEAAEASSYYDYFGAADLISNEGVIPFLREVTRHINSPQSQHELTQLLLVAEKYEHVLRKLHRADEVLYEVCRD